MPDVNSVAAKVDALTQVVKAAVDERDALRQENAELTAQLAAAQAATPDPTVLEEVENKLDAAISFLAPVLPA